MSAPNPSQTPSKRVKTGGRKRVVINDEVRAQISDLASIGMKMRDIAILTEIPESVIQRRFSGVFTKQRAAAKAQLLREQWGLAMSGSKGAPMMQVWLGKNYGEQSDRADITSGGEALKVIVERIGGSDK